MAGSLSNAGEELALNMLFRNTGTKPSAVYLGLATSAVGESDGLGDITEEDDAGYSRLEVTFGAPSQVEGAATVENSAQLEFGPWSAEADNAITHAFLCDAETGTSGDILAWFELPNSKQPVSGESLIVTVGDCKFDLD